MLSTRKRYRGGGGAVAPLVIGVGLAFLVSFVFPGGPTHSSQTHQPAPTAQPLFRGHIKCTTYEQVPPRQMNLMADLEVNHGRQSLVTFQYICNGQYRSTAAIQMHYHVNPDKSVTFTWHSSEPRVQWLVFIPDLGHIVNTRTTIRPSQTSITIHLKPGEEVRGATLKACAPGLPPASIGVTPETCQVSGVRPSLSRRARFFYCQLILQSRNYYPSMVW